jgi:alcohol dehydrogenase (cytochrome c)
MTWSGRHGGSASGTNIKVSKNLIRVLAATGALAWLACASAADSVGPTDAQLREVPPGDWLHYNRTYAGDRYSPLSQINTGNAAHLAPRCMLQLGEIGSFEPSPLAYEGRLYLTTGHRTYAVDAKTCALLWSYTYTPTGPEHIPSNRGTALYEGKLYRGTTDAHLISLDAKTGKLLWDVQVADATNGYFISAAPMAYAGKIFVGEGGADHGIKGHIHALDAATGRSLWTFEVVPAPGQPGADTWSAGQETGGGSSWSSMAVDTEKNLVLVPTGNPGPDFNPQVRKGANLYTDSVVALDANTGKLAWYVQQVPGDYHDWDTAAAPAIYDLAGRHYMAVASKNGFLYLYDRDNQQVVGQAQTMKRVNVDTPFSMTEPVKYCPGGLGQWNGPAYSPQQHLVYVGSADRCDTIQMAEPKYVKGQLFFGGLLKNKPGEEASGEVHAVDAATGKEVWSYQSATVMVAGVTPTAGGLLLTGDGGGHFLAFDAKKGTVLYDFMTGGGIAGGVTTYTVDGEQLIAVPSGNSSRGTWNTTGSATLFVFGLAKH